MISPRALLVVGAAVLLLLALGVALLGRALRSHIAPGGRSGARRAPPAPRAGRDWAVTPLPTGLARTLTQRGLVNAQQLASMSDAEREFFVATVGARVGEGAKPRLVGARPGETSAAPTAIPSPSHAPDVHTDGPRSTHSSVAVGGGRDPIVVIDTVTSASLVSGAIHCPVCRALLGQRTETLLMSKCPGCGRRVAARVDGERLIVTVDYGKA